MTQLAVITASYAPDLELFGQLHRSVLRHTDESTVHHVIVPGRDREVFSAHAGPRCVVWTASDLLPRTFVGLPGVNGWVNLARPLPPVRGWIMQQLLKLAATARSDAQVALLLDSDVALVAKTTADQFRIGGATRFYRLPDEVGDNLPEHAQWHRVAASLLGVPEQPLPLPDYVSALNAWSPDIVRQMIARIEQETGRSWMTAVSAQWTVSEFILYGVFVDRVLGAGAPLTPVTSMLCHSYWETTPLTPQAAEDFVNALGPDDIAIMISAKSHTPMHIREAALERAAALRA